MGIMLGNENLSPELFFRRRVVLSMGFMSLVLLPFVYIGFIEELYMCKAKVFLVIKTTHRGCLSYFFLFLF